MDLVDPAVNAMVARDDERAFEAAWHADERAANGETLGALHGLPIGVKDLDDVAGLRTTYGSPLFRDHIPGKDQLLVRELKTAGAIVAGKTNVPEWGAGANTRNAVYGATGNPFDPTKSAAGSSGGSGVALATGMVPLATGSDTGGSLRNPAAYNGIVGFRPSPGLIPSEKRPLGWHPLSLQGPMARTVPDLCLMLSAMVSDNGCDPFATTIPGKKIRRSEDFAEPARIDLSSLRVAFTTDFGFASVEAGIKRKFASTIDAIEKVFAVAQEATPDCSGTDEVFEVLRSMAFLTGQLDNVRNRPDMVGPNVRANVEEGLRYTALDVTRALTAQTTIYRRWQAFFDTHDIILSPAVAVSPRPWTELYPSQIEGRTMRTYFNWLALAYAVTIVGHPAISLPVGLDEKGMPFGLQIVGPRGGDAKVLAVAAALEDLFSCDDRLRKPSPDIDGLINSPAISSYDDFLGFY